MRAYSLCFAAVLLLCLLSGPAHAAGFNCAKAATQVEKAICADAELSALDSQMSDVYKSALADPKTKDAIKNAQRAWIKRRDACVDNACLKLVYTERMAALGLANPSAPAPVEQKPQAAQAPTTPQAPPPAGEGWTQREALLKRLNWPAECEADFKDTYNDTGMTPAVGDGSTSFGVDIHALEGTQKIAIVQCGMAAYQPPFVVMLFDEAAAGPGKLLIFKQYDRETSGKVTVIESSDMAGWTEFSDRDKTLTVLTKARGVGDCGSQVTYSFKNGQAVVVEARAQACHDNEKKWITDPAKWRKVEKP
jgi:uncharacterized protein